MTPFHNIFACLVHESYECVIDLVRNLAYFDPESTILLYDGSGSGFISKASYPITRHGNILFHPDPRKQKWGRLHGFALDCMQYALNHLDFETLTIVDSDQLLLRQGYSEMLFGYLRDRPHVGLLGSAPFVQPAGTREGPARVVLGEPFVWQPVRELFPERSTQFPYWTFWPSTVFTRPAATELVPLFERKELQLALEKTNTWATEEVVLPSLAALLGYRIAAAPGSYDYVRYKARFTLADLHRAVSRSDIFWMHPVSRVYGDALRTRIREHGRHYTQPARFSPLGDSHRSPESTAAGLALTLPTLERMQTVEGWLSVREADLLIAATSEMLSRQSESSPVLVELGCYCGRTTVVLGRTVAQTGCGGRVYAIDPHDGRIGALDRGIESKEPSFTKFERTISDNALGSFVQPIVGVPSEIPWSEPIHFLVVDGLHDYVSVAKDFYHFEAWLADEAYVAFHDYADYYPGVKAFVDELAAGGQFTLAGQCESLVVLRKARAHHREAVGTASRTRIPVALGRPGGGPDSMPLVTCVLPTADRPEMVPQAISYFLRQDYPNLELLILDDGREPVTATARFDERIRVVRLNTRHTLGAKYNLAGKLASGEILCHWDDDDWMANWRVSYQIQRLIRESGAGLCGLSRLFYYEPATERAWEYLYPPHGRPWVAGGTFCYRKALLKNYAFPDLTQGTDTIFVWNLSGVSVIPLPDQSFYVATMHPNNSSPKRTSDSRWRELSSQFVRQIMGQDFAFYNHSGLTGDFPRAQGNSASKSEIRQKAN